VSDYKNDGSAHFKSFGGLFTIISGNEKQTAWDDLRIEDCAIYDVGPIGMAMMSSWMSGHQDNDPKTWYPSRNVVVRGNRFEHTARNGLIVRGCVKPLIEKNFFKDCAYSGSGNACFSFHCDDALFQFNESCFTRYNTGDTDATGFDSDYCCRRSVFQYNYSHDNEYGFFVACSQPPNGFNEGTIVRYNISQNDGGNVFRFSGNITNTEIYNNTIYIGPKMTNPAKGATPRIIYNKSWQHGWSDKLNFHDNVFINLSKKARYTEGESTNNAYSHNLFFGVHPPTEPKDSTKLLTDPMLAKPGGAKLGIASAIAAYSPRPGAPDVGAGAAIRLAAEKNGIVPLAK
jgi:Right handed beta helix region